jgi:hypothetical protein
VIRGARRSDVHAPALDNGALSTDDGTLKHLTDVGATA